MSPPLHTLSFKELSQLRAAWFHLLAKWKALLVWHFLVWLLFFLLLSPLTAWILGFEIFRGGSPVVANVALLSWALSWRGFLHLALFVGLGMMTSVVRFSGIFFLLSTELQGSSDSIALILRRVLRMLPRLLRLCLLCALGALLWLLVYGAGVFLIYRIFLGEFDINYYLSEQPRAWSHARAWLGVWSLAWLLPSLWFLGRVLLLFPAYLTGDYPLQAAFRKIWALPARRGFRLLRLLGTLLIAVFLLRLLADSLYFFFARVLLQATASVFTSIRPLLAVAGAFIVLGMVFSFLIGFLIFNLGSILLTRFYFDDTPLHREAPPVAIFPHLGRHLRHFLVLCLRPFSLGLIVLMVAGISILISLFTLSRLPEVKDVRISAHRTGPPPAPENTLAALDAAIKAGADFTEIDVQLTADGRVVVVHDQDLMRVAASPLVVTRSLFDDMRDLVQTPDDGSPPARRKVATLEDFLEEAEGRIQLMIELKYYGFDPRLAVAVEEILNAHPQRDPVVLMSLDLPAVVQLQERMPDLSIGYLLSIGVGDPGRIPADFYAVSRPALNPELLRRAAHLNREVHVWTVNRKADLIEVILMGVDGLITDDPALAVRIRDELVEMSKVERLLLRWIAPVLEEE